jgi:hypothetical protein
MNSFLVFFSCLTLLTGSLRAQDGVTRHNFEIGAGGFFPLSGYSADNYSAGPALRPSYELRPIKPLGVEVGYTSAWMPGTTCSRFGCEHPRETVNFLDYGLRGHLPVAAGRVDLSAGVGGGYVWYQRDSSFYNGALFQYSGKAAVALDHAGRLKLAITLRTWRDLGRPTQQWLSTTGSLIFGFGK